MVVGIRGSLSAKVVGPLALAVLATVGFVQWQSVRNEDADLERLARARGAAVMAGLAREAATAPTAIQGLVAAAVARGDVVEATIAAGSPPAVAASSSPGERKLDLDVLPDDEVRTDLLAALADDGETLAYEDEDNRGFVQVFGRFGGPVSVDGTVEHTNAVAHLTIDVREDRAAVLARNRERLVGSAAGALLIALVAIALLQWMVTRRLRHLGADVARAGEGAGPVAIGDHGADAIGRLAAVFRASFQVISDREHALADSNTWLRDEVARREAAEAENHHQARHDALTGLANRAHAVELADAAFATSDTTAGARIGALSVNLDRFTFVNESLGHDAGDQLLTIVAARVVAACGPDIVARVGGDEFAVVMVDRPVIEIAELAERLLESTSTPVMLGADHQVFASVSIGVAIALDGDDAEALLRKSGLALTRAKERGRARVEWFDDEMRATIEARAEIETALRHAIEEARPGASELELWYQPIVDLEAGRVRGFESLIRWRRNGEIVAPGEFVAIAEDTGLILPLGDWILKEAAAQAGQWQRMFADRPPTVAVNVSGRQLAGGGLPSRLRAAITAHRLVPEHLTIELTESVLLDDVDRARATLDELKQLGVKLAIDDFGTGYSSLTYLRQFPIDVVKVDRSFVGHLGEDEQDSAIVAAVIAMAHALGKRVVCEGVESAEQVAGLLMLGADDGQGWFFAKALPADEATRLYANGIAAFDGDRAAAQA